MAATTLDPGHSGARAVRRVLRHYVRKGRKFLNDQPPADDGVHEARKALNKSRAALHLLRPALGRKRYRRTNRVLRDSAHSLNSVRDALVLTQTLDGVRRDRPALRDNRAAAHLTELLKQELGEAHQQLLGAPDALQERGARLRRIERDVRDWSLRGRGWSTLGPAVRELYRQGRRALPSAAGSPPDEALHAWRKRIKHLRYALRMLAPIQPQRLALLERQAGAIASQLGDAHDLAILRSRAQLLEMSQSDLPTLLQAIEWLRLRRGSEALTAGERLFRERPRTFERQLGRAWRRWRHGRG